MNATRLMRRIAGVLLVLVGLSIISIAVGQIVTPTPALAAVTSLSSSSGPPVPKSVHATMAGAAGKVLVKWGTAGKSSHIGGYIVYRNAVLLAKLPATDNGGPTTYTDPHPVAGSDTYTVATYAASGQPGQPSPGSTIQVTGSGQAAPAPAASSSPPIQASGSGSTNGDGGGLGTDIKQPGFQGNNAPSEFELYGSAVGKVHNTFGLPSWSEIQMSVPTYMWFITAEIGYFALALLAWALSPKLYEPLIGAVNSLVHAIFSLPLYGTLELGAMVLGVGGCMLYFARGRHTWVLRGIAMMLVGIAAVSIYATNSSKVVNTVMTAPLAVGESVLGSVEHLMPGPPNQFNIQATPTYNGNANQQDVRRFQQDEFSAVLYPGACVMSLGDLTWATTHYVPDTPAAEAQGFKHLTYCEWLLRSEKTGLQDAYITQQVEANGPPIAKAFIQGSDPLDHLGDAFLLMIVSLTRSAMIFLLILSFIMGVVMLGIQLVKLCLILLGMLIPQANPVVYRLIVHMGITTILPVYLAGLATVSLALSSACYLLYSSAGWMIMMLCQFIVALATLVTAISFWRANKNKRRNKAHLDGTPGGQVVDTPGGSGAGSAVQAGAALAAGAATGGTATAVAVGAQATRSRIPASPSQPRPAIPATARGSDPAISGPDAARKVIAGRAATVSVTYVKRQELPPGKS